MLSHAWPELAAALLLSLCFGSFIGVLVDRLPNGGAVVWDRSRCASCGTTLGVRDLVPVLSWLAAAGRCRHCNAPIGIVYPAIEIAALLIALWSFALLPGWLAWATAGLGWLLLALAMIDARHLLLPDVLTLPLIPAGLLVIWLIDPERLWPHGLAACAGFAALFVVERAYRYLRGREGLGRGDAKLLAAAGAWVGLEGLPSVLLVGAASALAYVLLRAAFTRSPLSRTTRLPFGPFLAAGLWLVWLYGPLVWDATL